MRNFCVRPVNLAIFLMGSRNIIFRTAGERNPYALGTASTDGPPARPFS